jgi:hypothetical protein
MQGPSSGGAGQPSQGQMQRGMEQGQAQREHGGGAAQREQKGKGQTTGQGQREQGQVQGQEREPGKSKERTQSQREQGKSKEQTQGQGQREQGGAAQREQAPRQGQQREQTQPQQGQSRDSGQRQGAQQGGSQGASVNLTAEQKTKIRQTVIQSSGAPRVTNVNFSVSVGSVVPRDRVKVVAVPQTIVEIHPQWRGYLYFIVNDEIVIVEPSSYRIVAVLVV